MSDDEEFSDEDPEYVRNMFIQKTTELELLSGASTSSCDTISKITAAIAFNDLADEKLSKLEEILKSRLKECRERMSQLIINQIHNDPKKRGFKFYQCGMPYFKDKSGWPAPENHITKMMKESNMIDYYKNETASWTIKNKKNLIHVIKRISSNMKRKELTDKIRSHQKLKLCTKKLKQKLKKIDKMDLKDLVLPIDKDYDWEEVARNLKYVHSAQECSNLWKLCLHPSINSNKWTESEQSQLQAIVVKHKEQNWEAIASELNTGRTHYQCFVHYMSQIANDKNPKTWTPEEDTFLCRIVKLCTDSDGTQWSKVATCMNNRRPGEVYSRWKTRKTIKGRFMPEEDEVLLTCVNKFGQNYKLISKYLERTEFQIKKRYQLLLNKKAIAWTEAEDEQIVKLLNNSDINLHYKHIRLYFPSRSYFDVRRRINKLGNNLAAKGVNSLQISSTTAEPGPSNSLANSIEKLNDKLKNQVEKEMVKVVLTDMDKEIMKYIASETFEDDLSPIEPLDNLNMIPSEEETAKNIQAFQILLKANLNKSAIEKSPYANYYKKDVMMSLTAQNKIRSYSKKKTTTDAITDNKLLLNVWGNTLQEKSKFVLPPSYNTLMASKILINNFQNCLTNCNKSISRICKNDPVVDEHYKILQERFRLMFLWPLRLSKTSHASIKTYTKSNSTEAPKQKEHH